MPAKAVTANRLADGRVIYLAADGSWRGRAAEAAWAEDEAGQAELLARAEADAAAARVVGPYLFEVAVEDGRPAPVSLRETIRAAGPTVRGDLGKQATPSETTE